MATSSPVIGPVLKKDFPEIQEVARVLNFFTSKNTIIGAVGKTETFTEEKGFLADSSFFKIFNYQFIEGNAPHTLDEPNTVVISSLIAKKLFGNEKALNKSMKIGSNAGTFNYTIKGVFNEKFGKSHLKPAFIVNLNSGGLGAFARNDTEWGGNNFIHTYLKLSPNSNPANLEAKFPAFLQKYTGNRLKEMGMKKQLILQKMQDIHLYSKGIDAQIGKVSDISFLNILLTIAFFIQLIACINFVNLSTARSVRRAKEVGVRKAIGANKSSLIGQFLSESLLISFLSIFLALPIVYFLTPFLNTLTDSSLIFNPFAELEIIAIALVLAIITGLLAGIYPALYLSNFKPVAVLKGIFKFDLASIYLRKGLVVFQFSVAIMLIVSVFVISKQLSHIQNQNLGFNQMQKIVISFPTEQSMTQYIAFKNELLTQKEVKNIGGTTYYPSANILQDNLLYKLGETMDQGILVKNNGIEPDFLKALNIEIIAGRNLTMADTSNQVVINEKALKNMKLDLATVVGTDLFSGPKDQQRRFTVVGVHKDYNNNSLKKEVDPLVSYLDIYPDYAIVDLQKADFKEFISKSEQVWKKLIPNAPFEFTFLDEDIQRQYIAEQTLGKIINSFTTIAILISCLGLFGLAMFTAEQRTKEIGVRKVLGATVLNITTLLSKEFLKPVILAILIASPIAYFILKNWLNGYAYKISLGLGYFILAGVAAILIALFTVGYQAVKAAIVNPVESLKTE
jgi:putative ABC transport system permease protein